LHLAVKDDETTASAIAFLTYALRAFPFQVTHLLTDRGSFFTADAFEAACEPHGVQHRKTCSYTPKTDGMVERFYGRVRREEMGMTLYSHSNLEVVLRGFTVAYNGSRQWVLKELWPEMLLRQCLEANPAYKPPSPSIVKRALHVVADSREISQPDSWPIGQLRNPVSRECISKL
jgi:transposase InsO family protein